MSNNVDTLIKQVFSDIPLPSEDDLCASVGEEALEETESFRNKNWLDLDSDFIASHQDALFWFSPAAFYYYFPAFLRAGLVTPNADYVLNILLFLRPETDQILSVFRNERWKLLNDKQIEVLEQWLCSTFPSADEELEDALRVIRDRYWWK